jgi:hypothetical protein
MSVLTVQPEHPGAGFLELSREALAGYAEALGRAWGVLGVGVGDRVVVYDYGSSPVAYLASRAFAPYLERGASELTGATALCVDGLADNVGRLAHVLRHFKPRFLFARAELAPLLLAGPTAMPVEQRTARLVLSADSDTPARSERASWEGRWRGGLSLLARCDAAAFLAAECPRCRALRVPEDLYEARITRALGLRSPHEQGRGLLTVRPRFLEEDPITTELSVRSAAKGNGCSHADLELA